MAQFRVEFVQDPASGKYLAELYHPDRQDELVVRTEAVYPSPEAAVLGIVHLFQSTIETPKKPESRKAKRRKAKTPKAKPAKAKSPKAKSPKAKAAKAKPPKGKTRQAKKRKRTR